MVLFVKTNLTDEAFNKITFLIIDNQGVISPFLIGEILLHGICLYFCVVIDNYETVKNQLINY